MLTFKDAANVPAVAGAGVSGDDRVIAVLASCSDFTVITSDIAIET